MTKAVDIERLKKKYLHCVSTQFDNAIFVAENEFLIDAYTKDEVIAIFNKIRDEIIAKDKNIKAVRSDSCCFFTVEEVLEILDKYMTEVEPQKGEKNINVVIDIPEEEYNIIKKCKGPMTWAEHLIAKGTPLPTIQSTKEDGKWIRISPITKENIGGIKVYQCSVCARALRLPQFCTEDEILRLYPYCHCGAKMVEIQESKE